MIPGELVELTGEGGTRVALVVGQERNRLRLVTEEGEQLLLPEKPGWRSLGTLPGAPVDPQGAAAEARRVADEIRRLQRRLDLGSLWELLVEEGERRYSAAELAELGLEQDSGPARAAIRRAIEEDRLLFHIAQDRYEPASRALVEETRRRRALAEQQAQSSAAAVAALRRSLELEQPLPPGVHEEELELLVGLALQGLDSPRAGAATELLAALGIPGSKEPSLKALDVLVRLGRFHRDENLHLLRARIPTEFPEPLLAEARKLVRLRPWEEQGRVDLTSLYTMAIDDPETTEVDDALSVERGPGEGWTVWVHIADPGAFVPPGSELLREAGRRAATLYLPDRKITMFPPELAEGPFSLVAGEQRAALTLRAEVTPEGEVPRFEFLVARIRVDERLSYDEADQLLLCEHGPRADLLDQLQEAAFVREMARRAQGAFVLNGPEIKIRLAEDGRILVKPVDRESASRAMVAEMMILVGCCAARLFLRNGIPAIYRVQEPPEVPLGLSEEPLDAAQFYAALRKLRRAELSRIPGRHAGLGVEPYVQMSSPIRRYSDLLLQQQMKSHLQTGRPCYDEEELLDALGGAEATVSLLASIEKDTRRYWTMRFLEGQKGAELEAMILEERHPGHYVVELTDTCLKAILDAPPGLLPGVRTQVALGTVDARRDRVHLRFLRVR